MTRSGKDLLHGSIFGTHMPACAPHLFIACVSQELLCLLQLRYTFFFFANPEGVNPSTRKCWKLSLN